MVEKEKTKEKIILEEAVEVLEVEEYKEKDSDFEIKISKMLSKIKTLEDLTTKKKHK